MSVRKTLFYTFVNKAVIGKIPPTKYLDTEDILSIPSLKQGKGTEMAELINTLVSKTKIMKIYQENIDRLDR